MKKYIVTLLLALGFTAPTQAMEPIEYCALVSELAYRVSIDRQDGENIGVMLNQINESGADPATQEMMVTMVTEAYRLPVQRTHEHREAVSQEFSADWAITCLKTLGNN